MDIGMVAEGLLSKRHLAWWCAPARRVSSSGRWRAQALASETGQRVASETGERDWPAGCPTEKVLAVTTAEGERDRRARHAHDLHAIAVNFVARMSADLCTSRSN